MFEFIEISSSKTHALRHSILRPNQPLKECVYPNDDMKSTKHFGAIDDEELVGIVSVYKETYKEMTMLNSWRFRGMATTEHVRGMGVGKQLLKTAENYMLSQGAQCIWANARIKAIDFYKKLHYQIKGEQFDIKDIGLHYVIVKHL
jgi:predicted GNAT family N-acyltransferase